ncbi:DUF2790 domain-containing protein [Pseudomonas rhodesiae]|uniref:DUF2790 domain-containing protein n=1 Tax=Pseudomonas rhodesiae TaxID=76760 RepID=UPI0028A21F80|nr:DUF2790 domain-containing protein [Pseudomonas rhodesiae]
MKTIKISVFIALAFASQFINAQTQSKIDVERVERANKVALENYASKVGEPVPEVKDYVYGMKLDVAKTIHVSPPVKYCGNVDSYMSYQDSQGKLHSIRYILQGDCPQKR